MLEGKKKKKIGFRVKNGEPIEALANRLNRIGYRLTGYTFLVKVWLRDAKKFLSFLVALHSRSRDMDSRSRFGQVPVEA